MYRPGSSLNQGIARFTPSLMTRHVPYWRGEPLPLSPAIGSGDRWSARRHAVELDTEHDIRHRPPRCATIAVGEWMLKHRRGATLHCQRPMPIANRLQAAECRATYDDSSGHARALARRHGVSKRWPIPLSPSRNPSTSRQEIDDCRWPSTIVRARDARAKRNQAGVAIRHKQSDSKKTNGGSSRQFEPG